MNKWTFFNAFLLLALLATASFGQGFRLPPSRVPALGSRLNQTQQNGRDIMDTSAYSLLEYRRMYLDGTSPTPSDLVGYWRGVNKGIVELVGYRQFIKEILPQGPYLSGENIQVGQVSPETARQLGWQVKVDQQTGQPERSGKFAIQAPNAVGTFGKGAIFSYRDADNQRSDPARLLVDKVVKIDNNHMLGRVTARFGLVEIPLAYFVLERM